MSAYNHKEIPLAELLEVAYPYDDNRDYPYNDRAEPPRYDSRDYPPGYDNRDYPPYLPRADYGADLGYPYPGRSVSQAGSSQVSRQSRDNNSVKKKKKTCEPRCVCLLIGILIVAVLGAAIGIGSYLHFILGMFRIIADFCLVFIFS